MDFHARKLKLIEWILTIREPELLVAVEALSKSGPDWYNDLSPEDMASLEKGISEASRKEGIPDSEAMKKFSRWL